MDSITQLFLGNLELPKLEAVVELMFLAAYADGRVSDEERAVFQQHVAASTHGQVKPQTIASMISFVERSVADEGRESRLASVRQRLPDERMRLAALELVIQVIRADNEVLPSESAFLLRAADALAITPQVALERLRVSYTSQS